MGTKGKRGKIKGGKKWKSERVTERKKKEEDSEGPAEVTTVGLLRGVGKRCPGFAMGGFHQGGGCSGFAVGGFHCSKTKVIMQETVHYIQENNVSWLGLDANRLPGFVCALLAKPALRIFNKGLFSSFA